MGGWGVGELESNAQGGRIFEISWDTNFPVNNFARNNGKIAPSSNDKTRQKYIVKVSNY